MWRIAMPLAALALAMACSGGDGGEPEAAVATVGVQTTCDMLFLTGDEDLWSEATELVADANHDRVWFQTHAENVAGELGSVAETSRDELRPHVETMADTLAELDAPGSTTDYETAAREVANVCTPYVAGDWDGN